MLRVLDAQRGAVALLAVAAAEGVGVARRGHGVAAAEVPRRRRGLAGAALAPAVDGDVLGLLGRLGTACECCDALQRHGEGGDFGDLGLLVTVAE